MGKRFNKGIKANITDERKATKTYRSLSKAAPSKADKKALQSIARDEARHHKTLVRIQKKKP